MVQRFGFCCKWLNDTSEFGGMKVNAKDIGCLRITEVILYHNQ
jgi:hypothetical protein